MLPLALAVRFCHFSLFEEPFLSPKAFTVDFLVAVILASFGYRLVRARQMARHYGWLFRRQGLLSWRPIGRP
jgi:hypothetical protein